MMLLFVVVLIFCRLLWRICTDAVVCFGLLFIGMFVLFDVIKNVFVFF